MLNSIWINRAINAIGDICGSEDIGSIEEFMKLKIKEKKREKNKIGGILKTCWGIRKT